MILSRLFKPFVNGFHLILDSIIVNFSALVSIGYDLFQRYIIRVHISFHRSVQRKICGGVDFVTDSLRIK